MFCMEEVTKRQMVCAFRLSERENDDIIKESIESLYARINNPIVQIRVGDRMKVMQHR